ncbi:MAG: iron-sulfur cluster assembly scaffold protein [Gemmatimonadetes bacterium]|nr:iron-sulfur cluster assembly scaffold protein [Gemmatimonadota bacterium]
MSQSPDMPLNGLYGESIMDHYRNPRNRHPVGSPDIEAHEFNPFCGDEVTLQIKLDAAGRVSVASAQSEGCSIIQAAASMLAREMGERGLGVLIATHDLTNLAQRFDEVLCLNHHVCDFGPPETTFTAEVLEELYGAHGVEFFLKEHEASEQ